MLIGTGLLTCENPRFWFNALSEAKIFDRRRGDFTDQIQSAYPQALDLFKIKN